MLNGISGENAWQSIHINVYRMSSKTYITYVKIPALYADVHFLTLWYLFRFASHTQLSGIDPIFG